MAYRKDGNRFVFSAPIIVQQIQLLLDQFQVFEPTGFFSKTAHENTRSFFGMFWPGMNLAHHQNIVLASANFDFSDVMPHNELETLGLAIQATLGF